MGSAAHEASSTASGAATLRRGHQRALFEQLADELRRMAMTLPVGTSMPSEAELMRDRGVSRTTVRRAIAMLVDEGNLVRRQGMGTFVGSHRMVHRLGDLGGFVEAFTEHGLAVRTELTDFGWSENPAEFPPGSPTGSGQGLLFGRLYRVDDLAWAIARCCIYDPYGSSVSRAKLQEMPSFEILCDELGPVMSTSTLAVSSCPATLETAQALGIDRGSAVLRLRRLLSAADGTAVQYAVYDLPADRFEFTISDSLAGRSSPASGPDRPALRLVDPTA